MKQTLLFGETENLGWQDVSKPPDNNFTLLFVSSLQTLLEQDENSLVLYSDFWQTEILWIKWIQTVKCKAAAAAPSSLLFAILAFFFFFWGIWTKSTGSPDDVIHKWVSGAVCDEGRKNLHKKRKNWSHICNSRAFFELV